MDKVKNSGKMALIKSIKFIPEGDYDLEINDINAGTTKDGNGYRVIVKFKVVNDEKYEGFVMQTTFSLENSDKKVERLSEVLFYRMLLSSGVKEAQMNNDFDTDLLLSKVVKAHVVVEPAKGEYPEHNRVFDFYIE